MKKSKAFTLIEILIIIVVIGILASVMIYSSTEAITTAKATEIINNLQTCKKAVLLFYADNPDLFEYVDMGSGIQNYLWNHKEAIPLITKYFDNKNIVFQQCGRYANYSNIPFKSEGSYGVADNGSGGGRNTWFVGYRFKENEEKVKAKVSAKAKSMGLFFAGRIPNFQNRATYTSGDQEINVSLGNDVVWMRVFGDWKRK